MTASRRQPRSLRLLPPALATRVAEVPAGAEWIHESKLDGYRIQCHVADRTCVLLTRNGLDWSDKFPSIRDAARRLAGRRDMILDGEIMMRSTRAHTSFQSLQRALMDRATTRAVYRVFDMLWYDGMDLRPLPLLQRRGALRSMLARTAADPYVKLSQERRGSPGALIAAAQARGDEGIISKRRDAPYHGGRSLDWLKIKYEQQDEFVVIGFTAPQGAREHFGSLLVATRHARQQSLQYAGRVGSGFDAAMLRELVERLVPRSSAPAQLTSRAAIPRAVQWVEPALVINANFAEWTADGLLRQATFGGIREDKTMQDVERERIRATGSIGISHAERVVDASSGVTKGDIAVYMDVVAPLMLPHVAGRPLSLLRCPAGAAGHCFFQKHWPEGAGAGITTRTIDEADGTTDSYAIATKPGDLRALVQANALEMHVWGSKFPAIERPDRVIFDLDPGPRVTWADVCDAARRVRGLLADVGLVSWVKLSGGKGLHVTVPVSGAITWDQASMFSKLVATRIASDAPKLFTSTMAKSARDGRIFIDWMRNSRGATAIAPWSLRARPGAPIAMPLAWEELDGVTRGDLMTIPDVLDYLRSAPDDPWREMLSTRQRVTSAMARAIGHGEA